MTFVRLIGRWAMTALVINCIIGGGIFGLPGELTRLLGRASPFAMILAALGMAVILACFAEVASQFSEPGGAYLYVRTAFGRFAGMDRPPSSSACCEALHCASRVRGSPC